MIKFNEVYLDDYVKDDEGVRSQICEGHFDYFPEKNIDKNCGYGICGVYGCNQTADHYLIIK